MQLKALAQFSVVFGTTLALSSGVGAAGFDCAKAGTAVERAICASERVSKMDSAMAAAYSAKLAEPGDHSGLKAAQRSWLKESRNTCQDEECLIDVYRHRLVS